MPARDDLYWLPAPDRARFTQQAFIYEGCKLALERSAKFTRRFEVLVDADPAAPPPAGSKRLRCIRHGEGVHNVFRASEFSAGRKPHAKRGNAHELPAELYDPPLTITGQAEAKAARSRAEAGELPDLVVTSPLRRTVSTALLAFEAAAQRGVPVLAHEDARECYKGRDPSIYDAHRDREELAKEFPQVSFANVPRGSGKGLRGDPMWWAAATQLQEENEAAHVERATRLMSWIMDRPEKDVALATHSLFLLALFHGVFAETGRPEGQVHLFRTGELRSVLVRELPLGGPPRQDRFKAAARALRRLRRPAERINSAWLSVALAVAILAVVTVKVR